MTLTRIHFLMNLMDCCLHCRGLPVSLFVIWPFCCWWLFFFLHIPRVIFNCQSIMMTGKPYLKCVPNAITKNKNMPFSEDVSWAHLLLHLLLTDSFNWLYAMSVGLEARRSFLGRGRPRLATELPGSLDPGALRGEVWVPLCWVPHELNHFI